MLQVYTYLLYTINMSEQSKTTTREHIGESLTSDELNKFHSDGAKSQNEMNEKTKERVTELLSEKQAEDNTVVNPWKVKATSHIDYDKLMTKFGTESVDEEVIAMFEEIAGEPAHPWIKRGIFFSHRALRDFITAYKNGEPVFLYTGRGPSSESLHTGHMIPFIFTKYLQDVFDCPLVIQMADDEKYVFRSDLKFEEVHRLGFENAKDIIAFGFNPEKTFIFSNRDYRLSTSEYEVFASDVSKFVTQKQLSSIFGFDGTGNIGMYMWPIYQSIAAFSKAFPHIFNGRPAHCLVAYAIDQDPYFRLARDIAAKMKLLKPCSFMSTFLEPLTGPGKMSSSVGSESTLFLTDTDKTLRKKINKYAFSGGGGDGSLAQHKEFGGNPDVDISCQYLKYFELDDDKYNDTCERFRKGELTCGETKKIMADKLVPLILDHQVKKSNVTDEQLKYFYEKKKMDISNKNTFKIEEELIKIIKSEN
jgi:tryptophanyl-tRNA synthetase